MKKYIFRCEKLLADPAMELLAKLRPSLAACLTWPARTEGCEAFFTDGEKRGYAIDREGNEVVVYLEWCEVVEVPNELVETLAEAQAPGQDPAGAGI